jgi:hypothetical protein
MSLPSQKPSAMVSTQKEMSSPDVVTMGNSTTLGVAIIIIVPCVVKMILLLWIFLTWCVCVCLALQDFGLSKNRTNKPII